MIVFQVCLLIANIVYSLAQCCSQNFKNVAIIVERSSTTNSSEIIYGCIGNSLDFYSEITKIFCENQTVEHLCNKAVQDLPNLNLLQFRENSMSSIEKGAFKNLPGLKVLSISNNNLGFISKGVINSLPVEELILRNNKLFYIEPGAFSNMKNLRYVSLEGNLLSNWDPAWFTNSRFVEKLDLSHNLLDTLQNQSFKALSRLTTLLLNDNIICNIEVKAFEGNLHFNELNLSNNRLSLLQPRIFNGKFVDKNESTLLLNGNSLMFLPGQILTSLRSLKILGIEGNPWSCPCQEKILTWAKKFNVEISKRTNEKIPVCAITKSPKKCVDEIDEEAIINFFGAFGKNYTRNTCEE